MEGEQFRQLQGIVLKSPMLSALLHNWDKVALPDSWLAAGAIAQTLWNHTFGFPPTHGINDIDIVHFDASDLSDDAEAEHAVRVRRAFSDLPVWIDVKNEARVHLWYEGNSDIRSNRIRRPLMPSPHSRQRQRPLAFVHVMPAWTFALPLGFPISLEELSVRTRGRSGGRFTSRRSFDGSRSGQTLVSWVGLRADEENRSYFRVRHNSNYL